MNSFFSGFEKKAAESSYMKDFAGGVDPTGLYTFNSAKRNALGKSKSHGAHRAAATVGGVVGGTAVATPLVAGTMGAVKGALSGRGGIRGRLASAAKGFVSGAKAPFKDVYHGMRGAKNLRTSGIEGAKPNIDHFVKKFTPEKVLDAGKQGLNAGKAGVNAAKKELSDVDLNALKSDPAGMAKHLAQKYLPEGSSAVASKELEESLRSGAYSGLGAFGMSGLLGGGSAYLQYGSGRKTGKELRDARMGRVQKNRMKKDMRKI